MGIFAKLFKTYCRDITFTYDASCNSVFDRLVLEEGQRDISFTVSVKSKIEWLADVKCAHKVYMLKDVLKHRKNLKIDVVKYSM